MTSNFIRVKNDLDVAPKDIIARMLEAPPSFDKADLEYREISGINHGLPMKESLLTPDFFHRITLIFRLLRKVLDLHMVNNTPTDTVLAIQVPIDIVSTRA